MGDKKQPHERDIVPKRMASLYGDVPHPVGNHLTRHLRDECDYEIHSIQIKWMGEDVEGLDVSYCPFCGKEVEPQYKPPNRR